MHEQTLLLMRRYGWTWEQVRAMPAGVIREIGQIDHIEAQIQRDSPPRGTD